MKYIHSLYIGLLSLLFVGCQEEQLNNMQTGGFLISLNDDVSTEVTTKSTPAELGEPATENFKLKIVNETTNDPLYDGAYKSGPIPASAGSYTVTASFGDNSLVALDEPYYKGEETRVVVEEGKTTSVQLACKVANALASVIFPDATEMAKIYESYWVKVAVENYSVKLKPNSTNSAYFQVGKEVSFYFEGEKLNGQSVSAKLEHNDLPTTFEAADHYTLTLTFNDDLTLDISKVKATTATIYETIPMEWLPKPKVTGFDAEGTKEITYTETADAVSAAISFSGAMPIEDWEMTLDFADPVYNSLNKKYTFSTLTEEDRTSLTQAGIVLPSLDEAKNGKIDFTGLTAKLQVASDDETSNTIRLRVKANNRWSSEEGEEDAFTIKTIAPEIVPTAKPEDIWTKTLTISGCEVKTGKLDPSTVQKYQYLDGSEWKNCEDGLAALSNIPSDNQMQVRAMYREGVYAKPVAIELEKPEQLPNSGMEEWYYEKVERTINTYYPWTSEGSSFWNTNNSYTTRYKSGAGLLLGSYPYNCFPAVTYVMNGRNGSKAAEIRSTASGRGNTLPSNVLDMNKVAGELFTGDISVVQEGTAATPSDHYTIDTSGRRFSARPTAMHFWYKYSPLNSDTWRARIVLMDINNNIIIENEIEASDVQNDWKEMSVKLNYLDGEEYAKCSYIYIIFSSTINPGSGMAYEKKGSYTLWEGNNQVKKDESASFIGSVLTIDDISLVYDK